MWTGAEGEEAVIPDTAHMTVQYSATQIANLKNETPWPYFSVDHVMSGHFAASFILTAAQAARTSDLGIRPRLWYVPAGYNFYYWNAKVEKGSQATDWTVAPEEAAMWAESAGRNLLRGSSAFTAANWKLTRATVPETGLLKLTPTTSAAYGRYLMDWIDYADMPEDYRTYTVSFDAREVAGTAGYTSGPIIVYFGFILGSRLAAAYFSSSYDRYVSNSRPYLGEGWHRYEARFQIPIGLTTGKAAALVEGSKLTLQFGRSAKLLPIEIRNVKLELGSKATLWSPPPEDTLTGLDTLRAYAESTQAQVDGKIDTWFFSVPPAEDNEPAVSWTTDALKASHTDDLYYDTSTGFCYRYTGSAWERVKDSDITSAMTAAGNAQDTADHKRRVFTSTPVPPYDMGDMWAGGSAGDILVCATAKAAGASYAAADWVLASKYTDDTLASAAQSAAATAQSTADTAQSTASSAQSAAATAQSTADSAQSAASTAQSTAETAQSTASAAQTAASTAQSAAEAAQADIDALAIGSRNLIWGTLNPSVDIGSRPAINGLHSDGTNHAGELVKSGTELEVTEHGLKTIMSTAGRVYFRFGPTDPANGSLLGLIPGETYTLSCDAEFKLLSGTKNSTTYNTYIYLYHDAAVNGTFAAGTVSTNTAYLLGSYTQALKGTVMTKHVEWTFTIPAAATMIYFLFANSRTTANNYAPGDYFSLSNLKLERGSRATDWTAAPEDLEEEIETKLAAVHARISNEGDSIRSEVQATYALASDMTQVAEQVSTLAEQTENNYTWSVTRVNQLQQDLDTAREATEEELAVMRSYMTFGEDGLSIGKTGNPFTFRVANDRLAFYMNDTEVAYLSNNKLYVTQAEILTRLIIGKFAFEPQSNGNLSLIFNG